MPRLDLLVDLLHFMDEHGLNAERALRLADLHFDAERADPDR